jgi:LytS/YehU family sensor histidine kinase
MFIPFLENAFKHGYSVNNDFFVNILVSVESKELNFKVENSINKDRKSKNMDSSGIGLENVRKRLDLLYKDEYLLEINDNEDLHSILLTIPLRS